MKSLPIAFSALLLTAGSSFAATAVFESFAILKVNSLTSTYYDLQAATVNPDFQGADLGTFDTNASHTLVLAGAEIKTWKNGESDVTGGVFEYRVFKTGDTPGDFSTFNLSWVENLVNPGDQRWDNTTENINLLSGLDDGDYTLEVFSYSTTNEGNQYSNNGGNNYTASFSVIPEPSAALLGSLGMLALLRRRK